MNVYSKDSLKLNIADKDKENIKDVAQRLYEQTRNQDIKYSIDVCALLNAFITECGVDIGFFEQTYKNSPTFIMMIGIPGSGKSTSIAGLKKEYNAIVVCPDDIRRELTGNISDQTQNPEVWRITKALIIKALKENDNVILDATNTVSKYRKAFIKDLPPCNKKARIIECDVITAFERVQGDMTNNVDRSDVPFDVIKRMEQQLEDGRKNIELDFKII